MQNGVTGRSLTGVPSRPHGNNRELTDTEDDDGDSDDARPHGLPSSQTQQPARRMFRPTTRRLPLVRAVSTFASDNMPGFAETESDTEAGRVHPSPDPLIAASAAIRNPSFQRTGAAPSRNDSVLVPIDETARSAPETTSLSSAATTPALVANTPQFLLPQPTATYVNVAPGYMYPPPQFAPHYYPTPPALPATPSSLTKDTHAPRMPVLTLIDALLMTALVVVLYLAAPTDQYYLQIQDALLLMAHFCVVISNPSDMGAVFVLLVDISVIVLESYRWAIHAAPQPTDAAFAAKLSLVVLLCLASFMRCVAIYFPSVVRRCLGRSKGE